MDLMQRRRFMEVNQGGVHITLPDATNGKMATASPNTFYALNNSVDKIYYNLRTTQWSNSDISIVNGSSPWFTIPAGKYCELKLTNFANYSGTGRGRLKAGIRTTSATNAAYASAVIDVASAISGRTSQIVSFTPSSDVAVASIFIYATLTPRYFQCNVELWVDGEEWL